MRGFESHHPYQLNKLPIDSMNAINVPHYVIQSIVDSIPMASNMRMVITASLPDLSYDENMLLQHCAGIVNGSDSVMVLYFMSGPQVAHGYVRHIEYVDTTALIEMYLVDPETLLRAEADNATVH